MRKISWVPAVLVAFLLASPDLAHSQEVHVAPQVSLADDMDFGLGGRALVNLSDMEGFEIAGSFDYFFPDGDVDYWELNGNLHYNIKVSESEVFFPYLGAGLNYANISSGTVSDSDVGLNLVGGSKFQVAERFIPYAELRIEAGGGEQIVVTGGLLF